MKILTYDVGTSGVKTCLYEFAETSETSPLKMLDDSYATYSLTLLPNGGAEQNPDEWWRAICDTTRELIGRNPGIESDVRGLSFCAQAQSLVLVDEKARPVRPSMSYMDQRSGAIRKKYSGSLPTIQGISIPFLFSSFYHTGVVSGSDKDPIWKYLWVKDHEPEVYRKVYKWLDVKDALVARMTGRFTMSVDSAFATLLLDRRKKHSFSEGMLNKLGIPTEHMPEIVEPHAEVGKLLPEAAAELGLDPDIPVFSGGTDAALIAIGSGCVSPGQGHIYMGTSGWASVATTLNVVDTKAMIASVVGVHEGMYNYFAELETAGKCLEWVRDHLALDEINIYLSKTDVSEDPESEYSNLYDYLSKVISECEDGSQGVIFTPWLHGNRCPFEDANARAMFFNVGLNTGKTEMLRAVIEGVCYHMRWFIEIIRSKVPMNDTVRFVGGGALSPVTAGILANVLQMPVETVADPQNVGAVGAAMLVARGLGLLKDYAELEDLIVPDRIYHPDPGKKAVHDRNYDVYTKLYQANSELFKNLNQGSIDSIL